MSLQDFFDKCEDEIELFEDFTINWSVKGSGFGQYHFYTGHDGKIHISNELTSRRFIKHILGVMVDQAVLDDEPFMKSVDSEEVVDE